MIRLVLAVFLIIALTAFGRGHGGLISAGSAHPAVAAERGGPATDRCCKAMADVHRVAATHCAADTILVEPFRQTGEGIATIVRPTDILLPEGRTPADPLQPPNALS